MLETPLRRTIERLGPKPLITGLEVHSIDGDRSGVISSHAFYLLSDGVREA